MSQSIRRSVVVKLAATGFVMFAFLLTGESQVQAALISHWALNDGAPSQTALDAVGPNSGTLGASVLFGVDDPTWIAASAVGSHALAFDGGDAVRVAHDPGQIVGNEMSVSAWIKRGRNGTREMFVGKGNGMSNETTSFWLEFEADNDLTFYLSRDNGGGISGASYLTPANVTDMTGWHNVVATFDGSTQRLYMDGVLLGSQAFAASALTDAAFDFAIGKLGSNTLNYQGGVDDVGLWSNGLTGGEAIALYNLAQQSGLLYDLGAADILFELHNAQSGNAWINGKQWGYTTGLSLGIGVVQQINSQYFLQLDASGTGVFTLPAPEPATIWMLGLGLLALRRRATRNGMARG